MMQRFYLALAVIFLCQSHTVAAPCEREMINAQKISARIMLEWPLRPIQDNPTRYVQQIADQLVPVIKLNMGSRNFNWPRAGRWQFHLIRDNSINAYSAGNGLVYLTDGIYAFIDSEAELAAIIAHEMAHGLIGHFCTRDEKHMIHRIGTFTQAIDIVKEMEADALAVEILQHTEYPPHAMLAVVNKLTVPKEALRHKALRAEALERQLEYLQVHSFSASPEFRRIRQEFKPSNVLHK